MPYHPYNYPTFDYYNSWNRHRSFNPGWQYTPYQPRYQNTLKFNYNPNRYYGSYLNDINQLHSRNNYNHISNDRRIFNQAGHRLTPFLAQNCATNIAAEGNLRFSQRRLRNQNEIDWIMRRY